MQYNEAVTEARRLVRRSDEDGWQLAQLTWEQIEAGASRRQWAHDIGVSHTTVVRWHKIWSKWGGAPSTTRPSYTDAWSEVLVRSFDLNDPESTRHREEAKVAVRNMPVEQRAQVARELIADQQVAYHAMRHPETRLAAGRAIVEAGTPATPIPTTDDQPTTPPPTPAPLESTPASLDVLLEISRIDEVIRRAARHLQANVAHLTDQHRTAILDETRRARIGLDWIDSLVSGGGISDEALQTFLSGGGGS